MMQYDWLIILGPWESILGLQSSVFHYSDISPMDPTSITEGSCHPIPHQPLNSFIFMYLIPFRKKISTPLQAFLDGRELIWPKAGGCVLCVCINLHWSLVSETRPLRRACWAVAMACVAWGNELVDTFWAFELALASFPSAPCVWPCLTHFEFKRCSTSSEASMHTPAVAFDFWKACSFNL